MNRERDPKTGRWLKKEYDVHVIKCACGCGEELTDYNPKTYRHRKYIKGHFYKGKKHPTGFRVPRIYIKCACGCGEILLNINKNGYHRKYIHGHNRRGKHNPNSMNISRIFKEKYDLVLNDEGLKEMFNIC